MSSEVPSLQKEQIENKPFILFSTFLYKVKVGDSDSEWVHFWIFLV